MQKLQKPQYYVVMRGTFNKRKEINNKKSSLNEKLVSTALIFFRQNNLIL